MGEIHDPPTRYDLGHIHFLVTLWWRIRRGTIAERCFFVSSVSGDPERIQLGAAPNVNLMVMRILTITVYVGEVGFVLPNLEKF